MFDELLAKLQFWKAKNFVVLDKHYEFMYDLSNNDAIAIRILKKFPGVIVEYTNIHMSADNMMAYDISIVANPNLCRTENEKFNEFTAAIFRSIILGSIENAKENNENGNTDTLEFDTERTLHEEIAPVPKKRVSNRKPRKKTVRRDQTVHSEVQQPTSNGSIGTEPPRVD